jgi:hypothetical protein
MKGQFGDFLLAAWRQTGCVLLMPPFPKKLFEKVSLFMAMRNTGKDMLYACTL